MNEDLDLTKILEGCPKGIEFYHAGYGTVVKFIDIDSSNDYPIRLALHNNSIYNYANLAVTKKGTISANYEGECLLFPSKEQRDWSKFERFWDKPKVEKFDLNTLQPFDKVLVRNYSDELWTIELFSYKIIDKEKYVRGLCYSWKCCIPYNKETKHLVGTKEDCPEYYKWWKK